MHIGDMSIGMLLLSIFLILFGLATFGLPIPVIITGIVAIVAGILILVGK